MAFDNTVCQRSIVTKYIFVLKFVPRSSMVTFLVYTIPILMTTVQTCMFVTRSVFSRHITEIEKRN